MMASPPPLHSPALRQAFPQLAQVGKNESIYLDSAATSLKPSVVIDRIRSYLSTSVASVHRSAHAPGMKASEQFEAARAVIARAIGAEADDDVVFTANTSYALLLLAEHLRDRYRRAFVTAFEHHSNLACWQSRYDVTLMPCDAHGRLHLDSNVLMRELGPDVVVSIAHASNVTGVVQPVQELAAICKEKGALLVVDGAQSFPHLPIDVESLGCDFFAFSPHKAFGPSGVGVLYGRRREWLKLTPRWLGGGTLDKYSLDSGGRTVARGMPHRYELGTPNVEAVLGAATAVEFLLALGRAEVAREADRMYRHLAKGLMKDPRVTVLGGLSDGPYINLVTISVEGVESEHLATLLSDRYGIYVRSGFHCAHPLYTSLNLTGGGVRFSAQVYTTYEECERVIAIMNELSGSAAPVSA